MAKKVKTVSHYLLILVLAGILIVFNLISSSAWPRKIAEADTDIAYTSVSVGNVVPIVSNVFLGGYPTGSDVLVLVEDTDIAIKVSATVTDSTCTDLNGGGVKAFVYTSSVQWDYEVAANTTCSQDFNDCYAPADSTDGGNLNCIQDSCSNGVAEYYCWASASTDGAASVSGGMWYHAFPDDSTSSESDNGRWWAMVIASDSAGADAAASNSVGVVLNRLNAIATTNASDSIAYGSIAPGSESTQVASRGVENTGNHGIDLLIRATDALQMSNGESIASEQQEYASDSFAIAEDEGVSLTETNAEVDLTLIKPASHSVGLTSDDEIFWGISIPAATSPGLYSGQTTYTTTDEVKTAGQ